MEILWVLKHCKSHVLNTGTPAIVLFWRHYRQSTDSTFIKSLLRPTKQGITEVNAVDLCMVFDVSDLLSGPQSTVPQENTDRKWQH